MVSNNALFARYCVLFHDLTQDPNPIWTILCHRLGYSTEAIIVDVGFEVCFFRDVVHAGLIERHCELEKQTFDLVLNLSDHSLVITEAKAQQGFRTEQMDMLRRTCKAMEANAIWPAKNAYLVGSYSQVYTRAS